MDADFKEKRRARISEKREKRWSMNSQRLEEIVAELMRPIGDLRHSFDTDLSALLEEYLTEAGLHALAADQSDDDSSGGEGGAGAGRPGAGVVPNFAEVALLLQRSACIYGRKVDCLYQHVLSVSDSLHSSTLEMSNTTSRSSEPATPSAARRRRSAAAPLDFDYIRLEPCAGATREPGPLRSPPTLPRLFIELEPRAAIADGDVPLRDYDGEPIGLLSDFHSAWPLQHGKLVEELGGCEDRSLLRPIPLMELQAAIEANAPPSPPPLPRDDSPPPEPARASTPHPVPPPPPPPPPPEDMPPPPQPKRERKRKSDVNIADLIGGSIKLHISKELQGVLSRPQEFDGASAWIPRVCGERERSLRALRAALQPHAGPLAGFDCFSKDVGGFRGWSTEEAAAAAAVVRDEGARRGRGRGGMRAGDDSDDDGFFEQSSLGDSDTSAAAAEKSDQELAEAAEWAAWQARVAARASAGQARAPLDVCGLATSVIQHLPEDMEKPFNEVLTEAAKDETDVSRLFLATLFLANAGNVEVVQGAPLALNSVSLKLLSSDPRLFMTAAASDPVSAPPEPQTPTPTPSRTSAVNTTR